MNSAVNMNKNVSYNVIKNVCGIIFPLITFPYISRVLGAENTGKINFGISVLNYFALAASLGASSYAVRECARVKESREQLSKTASQIFSITVLSAAMSYLALFVTLAVAKPLAPYKTLILIQSVTIIFTITGADWLNTAMSDFKFITLRTAGMQLLSLVLMFLFVHHKTDYYIYAWISVLASGGAGILNVFYRRRYCTIQFTTDLYLKKHIPPIMVMFSMIAAQTVFVSTDTMLLGLFRGDFEAGLYGASTKIYNIVNTVVASIAWVVMPQMSELFAKKEYGKINDLLRYALNFILILGIPAIIGLNLLSSEIIEVLAGKEYAGAASSLRILTVSLLFSFAGGFVGNIILIPSKKEKIMLVSCIVSAALNLGMNLWLIPAYGPNAAAATTAAANAAGFLTELPFADKEIKITGIREMMKAPMAGSGMILLTVFFVKKLKLNRYMTVFLAIAASVAVYLWTLLLLKDEFARNYVTALKTKMKGRKYK